MKDFEFSHFTFVGLPIGFIKPKMKKNVVVVTYGVPI